MSVPEPPLTCKMPPEARAFLVRGGDADVFGPDSDVRWNLEDQAELDARFWSAWHEKLAPAIRRGQTLPWEAAKKRVLDRQKTDDAKKNLAGYFDKKHAYREFVVEGVVYVARMKDNGTACDQVWAVSKHTDYRRLAVYFSTPADLARFDHMARSLGRDAGELAAEILTRFMAEQNT